MVSIRLRFVHSDQTNKGKLFHCHSPPVNVGSPFVPQTIHTFDQHLSEIKSNQGCDASWGQLNNHGAPIRSEGDFCKLVKVDPITFVQAFSRHSNTDALDYLTDKFPSVIVTGNEVTLTLRHIMWPQSIHQASTSPV